MIALVMSTNHKLILIGSLVPSCDFVGTSHTTISTIFFGEFQDVHFRDNADSLENRFLTPFLLSPQ